ncbi:alpha-1,4 glucan phosphorylase L-2 isozyme, chloroplastic/amyloplastic [Artemisia annua]|uniref:Alpha-1,4 glucan phosphorylase L-2 isozyme, chloroplastic/amyloplastic n=1 Tax=Artemisia annua TaxID=35608 RepID=A0A2U1NQJ9_ARTAN|nr:alpha-1,4 glucan phosphorylase L-2 isozyme, chloroplastic/amyloplastic [Artemisia annua]
MLVISRTEFITRLYKNDYIITNNIIRESDEKIELCRFSKDGTKPSRSKKAINQLQLCETSVRGTVLVVPDSESVISSIEYHAEFTQSFSPHKFELPKALYATAETVRDELIVYWNATYAHHEKDECETGVLLINGVSSVSRHPSLLTNLSFQRISTRLLKLFVMSSSFIGM